MTLFETVKKVVLGTRPESEPCEPTPSEPWVPRPGEFFDPVYDPASWDDPDATVMAQGPVRVEVGRLGPRRYRLLRYVGYRDTRPDGETWVLPRDLDTWDFDFSSAPTLVNWIIPVRGSHFNAFVLHDALVEDKIHDPDDDTQLGDGYFGKKVPREEADRAARDAMLAQGTGFFRSWIAWASILIATIYTPEGLRGGWGRRGHQFLFVVYMLAVLIAGVISTGEIFNWWNVLPWMEGEAWPTRLLFGAVGAILSPVVLALVWLRRYVFGFITGGLLAVLLPALVVTSAVAFVYWQAERVARALGWSRPRECTLDIGVFGSREPTASAS